MAKFIVFCADGTWNGPGEPDEAPDQAEITNVLKLYMALAGEPSAGVREQDEQEKTLVENGATLLVAKYIHGVGDSSNKLVQLMGGAFGAGLITRIVRGYTFISRNYQPDDRIVITGFSRGAYTARALAGLIASQGLLRSDLAQDRDQAYRRGAEAWYRYRNASPAKPSFAARLVEIVADLPAFVSRGQLKDSDLVSIDRIAAVAVWDTVGALGLPKYAKDGDRKDVFEFADNALSAKVERGIHAIALDERREDFVPAIWKARAGVEQVLFPGAHADVGGGYRSAGNESGLSDHALRWMVDRLRTLGLRFNEARCAEWKPDPAGVAHQPWEHAPWNLKGVKLDARQFPAGLPADPFVAARQAVAGGVVPEPGKPAAPYAPINLP